MLSENIRNLRKQKGYTQETLAQALNIVRQTVSKWEKGYSVPDAEQLEQLADLFEVPVSDLLDKPSETPEEPSELEKISAQLAILNEQMAREVARRKRSRKIKIYVALSVFVLLIIGTVFIFHSFGIEVGVYPGDVYHVEERQVASSLYSNTTYHDWSWILVRDEDGGWKHISHGYG